jgi:type I restriction enzyme M protein
MASIKNAFCSLDDLRNEAAVETFFINRLLVYLGYPDSRIRTKDSIETLPVPRGSTVENYRPDYVLLDSRNQPIIVIDAKHPNDDLNKWVYQVVGYAATVNRRFPANENPVRYAILCNGHVFSVYPWDSNMPVFHLRFEDFVEGNTAFAQLKSNIAYGVFNAVPISGAAFLFFRPELTTLTKTFNKCHDLIWKKEKQGPTWAFYEFVKIIFVKMREDRKIHQRLLHGEDIKKEDFVFSVHWLEKLESTTPNPFDTILFKEVRDEIEEQIKKSLKKRIFAPNEKLRLTASTTKEVVRLLEHYDLHGIDEDLNGRMFETFLSATIRGRELGQYFTPRPIVRYMASTAGLNVTETYTPHILDGCCGTGGFLIEAMAILTQKVQSYSSWSSVDKESRISLIKDKRLFGIEANEDLSRVARLNMYLHGDGGSKVFHADALDKNVVIEPGLDSETEEGRKELHRYLVDEGLKFDVILTNPPFSMPYKKDDPNEKRILDAYRIAKNKVGKLATSEKSNVLFLERYLELLQPEGELLTIIDDTVLNGESSTEHRTFIKDNFIIRQVLSLPFNAFFKAGANIKTSILHLRRKRPGEQQGDIFMAITHNVGHDDHKRDTPNRDNLGIVSQFYNQWVKTGKLESQIIKNQSPDEPLACPLQVFVVPAKELGERLDAFYYAPELKDLRRRLLNAEKRGEIEIRSGSDLSIIDELSEPQVKKMQGEIFKYFEITDVTKYGAIVSWREDFIEALPTRGRLQVEENDVIFAKNNSSRGTTVIIPKNFNKALVTTGFIGIRPSSPEDTFLIWSVLTSEAIREQIYYLAVTASQPEIRQDIFEKEFFLPFPKSPLKEKVVSHAMQIRESQNCIDSNLREVAVLQQQVVE